jgi:hypothetical protein
MRVENTKYRTRLAKPNFNLDEGHWPNTLEGSTMSSVRYCPLTGGSITCSWISVLGKTNSFDQPASHVATILDWTKLDIKTCRKEGRGL